VLTDANFDTTGQIVPAGTPGAPGAAESLRTSPRRTGTPYWMGVAAVDGGGNRGTAAIVGPVTPLFDQTAAILPPVPNGNTVFGTTIARGRFNDDDLWDVAIGATGANTSGGITGAGVVYVYFGTPDGIQDVPDVEIEGTALFGGLGISLAAVNWSSATREDLVIGEPYSNGVNGRVYIFEGGPAFGGGTYSASIADVQIGVAAASNYFTGGGLGYSLAALDFDGDGTDDLAIGDAAGGGGNGGVAIVYGGTVNGSQVLLSNTDSSGLSGAVVHLIDDPAPASFDFAASLHNVGRTTGPSDSTEDLLVGYVDTVNKVYVLRGSTSRPSTEGVHTRGIVVGQDVRIDHAVIDAAEMGTTAGSIPDLNGDGAREIVIGEYRLAGDLGQVLIIDGDTLGTGGIAVVGTPGVVVSTITAGPTDSLFGAAIANNGLFPGADVDGDGLEDLLIAGRRGGIGTVLVWFGGSIPVGSVTAATAQHVITGPSTFNGPASSTGGPAQAMTWAGDVNGDGLADVCWGNGTGNGGNGAVQVLWDDGT
jgi:hypothetical protein